MQRLLSVAFSLFLLCFWGACEGPDSKDKEAIPSPVVKKSGEWSYLYLYQWQLADIVYPALRQTKAFPEDVPLHSVHMRLYADGLSVQGGCNTMYGTLSLQKDERFQVSALKQTEQGCPFPLEEADTVVFAAIADAIHHQRLEQQEQVYLKLSTKQGVELLFLGIPTPELQYGKATERFVELAVYTTPCMEEQCFSWREITYSDTYDQIPVTEWSVDFPGIEGFTPQLNHTHIVRVQEYQTNNGKRWTHDLTVSTRLHSKKRWIR